MLRAESRGSSSVTQDQKNKSLVINCNRSSLHIYTFWLRSNLCTKIYYSCTCSMQHAEAQKVKTFRSQDFPYGVSKSFSAQCAVHIYASKLHKSHLRHTCQSAKTFQTVWKLSKLSGKVPDNLKSFKTYSLLSWFEASFYGQFCKYAQNLSGRQCRHADGAFLPLPQGTKKIVGGPPWGGFMI